MGLYINGRLGDHKQAEFLKLVETDPGVTKVTEREFYRHVPGHEEKYGVVVINNGPFDEAGIIYNKQERDRIESGLRYDPRLQNFYIMTLPAIERIDPTAVIGLVKK